MPGAPLQDWSLLCSKWQKACHPRFLICSWTYLLPGRNTPKRFEGSRWVKIVLQAIDDHRGAGKNPVKRQCGVFRLNFFSVRDVKQWLPGDTMCFTANRSWVSVPDTQCGGRHIFSNAILDVVNPLNSSLFISDALRSCADSASGLSEVAWGSPGRPSNILYVDFINHIFRYFSWLSSVIFYPFEAVVVPYLIAAYI